MTLEGMITQLQDFIAHGVKPTAVVKSWDGDSGEWQPVSGFIYDADSIELQTDIDECDELPAAPGSVPPLKVEIVTPEELERQQNDPTNYMCGVPQAEPNTKESYERGLKDALAVVKGGKNIVAISNLLKRPAPPAGAAQPGDDKANNGQ